MPSAAILAGGHARRFGGRDKSQLVVDGRTILERQIDELSQIVDDIMIVSAFAESRGPASRYKRGDVRHVADREPDRGPLGGLDAALAAARSRDLVVIACDMPFVSAALLAYLLSFAGNADAVVPRTDRGYHPLCAVYTHGCAMAVERNLAEGRLKMVELLARVRIREVPSSEIEAFGPCTRLLANVNSPIEFEELGALSGHQL
jgi:molybdenum cofactor guanylyltransferase